MKFWDKIIIEIKNKPRTLETIYNVMIGNFASNIFTETKYPKTITKTYYDLDVLTRKVANKLKTEKIEKNSFVAISLDNSIFYVAAFFGVLMAGFKPLLINYRLKDEEIDYVYNQSKCQFTITDDKYVPKGKVFKENDFQGQLLKTETWADELVMITSGTTGKPKLILYNGEAIAEQMLIAEEVVERNYSITNDGKANVVMLAFLPYYHVFGLITSFLWFAAFGQKFIFLDSFEPLNIQKTVIDYKVTHFFAVPLVWNGVARKVYNEAKKTNQDKKLKRMLNFSLSFQSMFPKLGKWFAKKILFRKIIKKTFGPTPIFFISGGGYIEEETLRLFNGVGYRLYNGYGSTEANIVSVELDKDVKEIIKGYVGVPFRPFDYKIENDILMIRGKSIYNGIVEDGEVKYINDEYFNTNDVFELKENNKLKIISRIDHLIIAENGENISPEQIEAKISHHYGINYLAIIQNQTASKNKILIVKLFDNLSTSQRQITINKIFKSLDELPLNEKVHEVYETKKPYKFHLNKVPRIKIKEDFLENKKEFVKLKATDYLKDLLKTVNDNLILEIKSHVSNVLKLNVKDIKKTDDFVFDLNGTSLDLYTLLHNLSNTYDLIIDFKEVGNNLTPINLSNIIKRKLEAR